MKRRRERGAGHLYLRGEVWWARISHRGMRARFSTGKTDVAEAREVLKDRLAEIRLGQRAARDDDRLPTLIGLLEDDYRANNRRTLSDLPRTVKRLREFFGRSRAREITTSEVKRYTIRRREAGAADATIAKELNALRRMLRLAVEDRRLLPTDIPKITVPRPRNARQGFLDPDEFAEFHARHLAPYPYLQPMARFTYATGWRKGEVLGLLWRKVHQSKPGADTRIVLDASDVKEQQARVLVLAPGSAGYQAIEEARVHRRPDCPHVFHRDGKPIRDFYGAWRKAAATFGRPNLYFHDFRRCAARNMTQAGVPEQVAMKITGHKTREMFDRYNIVAEDDVREAGLRVEDYTRPDSRGRLIALERGTRKGHSASSSARRGRR